MCKSSSLAFVLLFAFLFRLEHPSLKLAGIIATMTAGVVMMVAGETAFSAPGFALVLAAAFFSGFRWALTQMLLLRHAATANPFSSIFFLAPGMFASLLVVAVPVEGLALLAARVARLAAEWGVLGSAGVLLFPGVLAFCMTASEYALLRRTSVVTLSICGVFKEVVTIAAAGVVFDDALTPVNVSGVLVTIGSIAAYNYLKITKMRAEARAKTQGRELNDDDDDDGRHHLQRRHRRSSLSSSSARRDGDRDHALPLLGGGPHDRGSADVSSPSHADGGLQPATSRNDHLRGGAGANNDAGDVVKAADDADDGDNLQQQHHYTRHSHEHPTNHHRPPQQPASTGLPSLSQASQPP
jgi:solute carrier family 35 protein C2